MSPNQAKALRIGQRVYHNRLGHGYVSYVSRSGICVTYDADASTLGYSWRHVWPLHVPAS